MNEKQSDPVFDSLLEEMLTEQHPPDLTVRIVNAWRHEHAQDAQNTSSPSATLVEAQPIKPGNPASTAASHSNNPSTAGSPALASTPARPAASAVGSVRTRISGSDNPYFLATSTLGARGKVALSLATCAAVLLIVLGIVASQGPNENAPIAENKSDGSGDRIDKQNDLAELPKRQRDREHTAETLELDDLPFSTSNTIAKVDSGDSTTPVGPVEKLNSVQVISELDRRLAEMWDKLGVKPNADFNADALARRMSVAMTGKEFPGLSSAGNFDKLSLANEATASMAFARHWADNFARLWFERSAAALDSKGVAEVKRVMANRIANGQGWNEAVLDLLGGELSDAESTSAVFVAALAGGENHRLVERVGASFLDANLACIRCHDAESVDQGFAHDQEAYWTLVALFKGIDARMDEERKRVLLDRQSELFLDATNQKAPSVFYDLPNGVLRSADAKLPDGLPWNAAGSTPRQALASWISKSSQADRATVNQVWKQVFGRTLVPQAPYAESVALEDRRQLLDFMAEQFRAHDHDLRQLVSWVVASEAFAKRPLELSKSEWLEASDADLEYAKLQELVFAAGPSLGRSNEGRTLESSLTAVVQWNRPLDASVTLAQPATSLDKKKPSKQRGNQAEGVEMPSMSFVLHGQQHTLAQQTFITRLLRSERLSWQERVQHVVGLSGNHAANGRVQQLAKDLLEQNSGNARDALLDLMWAVQNADAS